MSEGKAQASKNRTFVPSSTQIQRLSREDLPPGAILIPKRELFDHQWTLINKWTPRSQVWALRDGPSILAGCAVISGIALNAFVRRRTHLLRHGRLTTYMATIPVPATLSMILHHVKVTESVMLREDCPSCLQVRAVVLQSLVGMLQPLLLSLVSCSAVARGAHTAHIPNVTRPLELLRTYQGILRPAHGTMTGLLALNVLAAAFITHTELKQISLVHNKLASTGTLPS